MKKPHKNSCFNCKWLTTYEIENGYGGYLNGEFVAICEGRKNSGISNLKYFPFKTEQKCCEINKTWVEFKSYYSICKETCEIKSHARKHTFGLSVRNVKEKILKVTSSGFVNCGGKTVKATNIYREVFGREYQ